MGSGLGTWLGYILSEGFNVFTQYIVRIETLITIFCPELNYI